MTAVELVSIGASLSLLTGSRLYAGLVATGLALRLGWLAVPAHLAARAGPWAPGGAGVGLVAELLADKIARVDSAWVRFTC